MSTAVSSRSLIERSDKPHTGCRASQEALREDGLKVFDDCPICLKRNVACEVGCHPSSSSARGFPFKYNSWFTNYFLRFYLHIFPVNIIQCHPGSQVKIFYLNSVILYIGLITLYRTTFFKIILIFGSSRSY